MYLLQFEIQQRKAGPERNSEKRKGKEGFGLEKIVFPEKKTQDCLAQNRSLVLTSVGF